MQVSAEKIMYTTLRTGIANLRVVWQGTGSHPPFDELSDYMGSHHKSMDHSRPRETLPLES